MVGRMHRFVWIALAFALTACGGGGGSTSPTLSDTPVLYVPGTATVVANPVTFTSGQSVQFEPQEGDYSGTFNIAAISGTAGAACIAMAPATVSNGGSFTASTATPAGCTSYPQSETYNVSDANGHGATVTVQINAP
jgi:hypothetical protein